MAVRKNRNRIKMPFQMSGNNFHKAFMDAKKNIVLTMIKKATEGTTSVAKKKRNKKVLQKNS